MAALTPSPEYLSASSTVQTCHAVRARPRHRVLRPRSSRHVPSRFHTGTHLYVPILRPVSQHSSLTFDPHLAGVYSV